MVRNPLFGVQNVAASRSRPRQTNHLRMPRGVLLMSMKHGPAAVEVNLIGPFKLNPQ